MKIDLFKPESVIAFYAAFILLTIMAVAMDIPYAKAGELGIAITCASFYFFVCGSWVGRKVYGRSVPGFLKWIVYVLVFLFYFFAVNNLVENVIIAIIVPIIGLFVSALVFNKKIREFRADYFLIMVGLLLFGLTVYSVGGIPVLDTALRTMLSGNLLWGAAVFSFLVGYILLLSGTEDHKKFALISILSILLFSVMLFRTVLLLLILCALIIAYYKEMIDWKKLLLCFAVAFALIVFLGYVTVPLLNPAKLILYRAGTTQAVFDNIVEMGWPFGHAHGSALLSWNVRLYIASLIGANVSITSTFLGPAVLDFGIPGAFLFALVIGFVLGLAYEDYRKTKFLFYPALLALGILWVEIGPDALQMLPFWLFGVYYVNRFASTANKRNK